MQGYYGTRQHLSATTGVRESKITRGLYRDITRALANAYSRPRASILAPMCVISLYSSACSSILWRLFSLFYSYFIFILFLSFFLAFRLDFQGCLVIAGRGGSAPASK